MTAKRANTFLGIFSAILFLFCSTSIFAQNAKLDSLQRAIGTARNDTSKIVAMINYGYEFRRDDKAKATQIFQETLTLSKAKKFSRGIGLSLKNLGMVKLFQAKYQEAGEFFKEAFDNFEKAHDENEKARVLSGLSTVYRILGNLELSMKYVREAIEINEKHNYQTDLAGCYSALGNIFLAQSKYGKAIENYKKGIQILEKIGDNSTLANLNNNLGLTYYYQSKYDEALACFQKAVKHNEAVENWAGRSKNFSNIGLIFRETANYEKALEYYEKSLEYELKNGNEKEIFVCYNNMASVYESLKKFEKAREFFELAHTLIMKTSDVVNISISFSNLGVIYEQLGEYDKALSFNRQAIEYSLQAEDEYQQSVAYLNLSSVLIRQEKYDSAMQFIEKSILIAKSIGSDYVVSEGYDKKVVLYERQNDYKNALQAYKNYVSKRDSVFSKEKSEQLLSLQTEFETERKEKENEILRSRLELNNAVISQQKLREKQILLENLQNEQKNQLLLAENKLHEEKIERQKAVENQLRAEAEQKAKENELKNNILQLREEELQLQKTLTNVFVIAVLFFLVQMFFIIRGRRKAEQLNKKLILKNEEVNQQNEEITAIAENLREANEENLAQNKALSAAFDEIAKKNADITSSIIYAQRIQRAILPPLSLFESTFADSFVFFKPRDIVSGDFYWLRKSEDETFAVIAVADCTGHGVPGAFMSMIGHDLLNEIFISKKIFKPAEILRSLDFSLKNALRQKDTSVNDGMDIVVCTVFFQEQKLFFAGAKNDMYVVENDTISTLKGSNFALGGQETAKEKIFDEQEISAQNKIFYLATDGFQDQFGGSEGKKFMSRNLKALLLKNSRLSFNAQAKELEVSLEAWKSEGKEKQIDDVLIVGFRI